MFRINHNQLEAFYVPLRKQAQEKILRSLKLKGYSDTDIVDNTIHINDGYKNKTKLIFTNDFIPHKIVTPNNLEYIFNFDIDGNIASCTFPGGEKILYEYRDGNLSCVDIQNKKLGFLYKKGTNLVNALLYPNGKTTDIDYTSTGNVKEIKNREKYKTHFSEEYRGLNSTHKITDSKGHSTILEINKSNGNLSIEFADKSTFKKEFDAELELEKIKRRDNKVEIIYYKNSYPFKIEYEDRSFLLIDHIEGKIKSLSNESYRVLFDYDQRDNLIKDSIEGISVVVNYNSNNQTDQITYPSGRIIKYQFDIDSNCSKIMFDLEQFEFQYGKNGTIAKIIHPNKVLEERTSSVIKGVTAVKIKNHLGVNLESHSYEYDELFRLIKILTRSNSIVTSNKIISYDAEDRITGVKDNSRYTGEEYRYDNKGNLEFDNGTKRVFGLMDEISNVDTKQIVYDKVGNIIQFHSKTNQLLKLEYNECGTLSTVKTQSDIWNYSYDAKGRRITKYSKHSETKYTWFQNKLVSETVKTSGLTIIREYIYLPYEENITPIGFIQDNKLYSMHADQRGAITCVTNPDGKIVWNAIYDSFGNTNVITNEIFQPWRLMGHYFDEETGLCYNYSRYYSPYFKSYISIDPEWFKFEASYYSYALNNPYNRVDKFGNLSVGLSIGIMALGVIGGALLAPIVLPSMAIGAAIAAGMTIGGLVAGGTVGAINADKGHRIEGAISGVTAAAITEIGFLTGGIPAVFVAGAVAGLYSSVMDNRIKGTDISASCHLKNALIGGTLNVATLGLGNLLNKGLKLDLARISLSKKSRILNSKGIPYPRVVVGGFGEVPFPGGVLKKTDPNKLRGQFTPKMKSDFKEWWIKQGKPWPNPPPGSKINIHHIKPLSNGGTNSFNNLVPLIQPSEHLPFTNWWRGYN